MAKILANDLQRAVFYNPATWGTSHLKKKRKKEKDVEEEGNVFGEKSLTLNEGKLREERGSWCSGSSDFRCWVRVTVWERLTGPPRNQAEKAQGWTLHAQQYLTPIRPLISPYPLVCVCVCDWLSACRGAQRETCSVRLLSPSHTHTYTLYLL